MGKYDKHSSLNKIISKIFHYQEEIFRKGPDNTRLYGIFGCFVSFWKHERFVQGNIDDLAYIPSSKLYKFLDYISFVLLLLTQTIMNLCNYELITEVPLCEILIYKHR